MRLTYEYADKKYYVHSSKTQDDVIQKLGQLEDIEEELDLDLRILLTLLKERKGWFLDVNQKPRRCYFYDLPSVCRKEKYFKGCIESSTYYYEQKFYFKDYGITWALTKEELEK